MSDEASVIKSIQYLLQDTGTATWGTADIQAEMARTLIELNEYSPLLAKGTVTFASTGKALSIAALTDLLSVEDVEYPVDKDPAKYRNFEVRGSTVIPDISVTPAAGATAFIWYCAPHTVSGTVANTLNKEEESLLIELTAARLVNNYALSKINTVPIGGMNTWVSFKTDGKDKLADVRRKLRRLKPARCSIRWPTV